MSPSDESLRYDKMVENALRGVVRDTVQQVVETGALPGGHHFYITFATEHPGVQIPDYLHERYPGEMTIVLQYQFEDLYVDDELMRVTLYFNNKPEKLVVPLNAISIFADPSVNFALQFQPLGHDDADEILLDHIDDMLDQDDGPDGDGPKGGGGKKPAKSKKDKNTKGEVVSLDTFRKKK